MVSVTGKLESAANGTAVVGGIEVMLCGYGSQIPRVNGKALVARIQDSIIVQADGSFSFLVDPNDSISPDGTYYTVTVKDDNGDVSQINAYRFFSSPTSYDLTLLEPFSPDQPAFPVPSPNLIPVYTNPPVQATQTIDSNIVIDGNLTVTGSLNFGFSVVELAIIGGGVVLVNIPDGSVFHLLLTQDVTIFLNNPQPGKTITFMIQQDGAGNHTLTWPAAVLSFIDPVNPVANGKTLQKLDTWPDHTFMQPGYYP